MQFRGNSEHSVLVAAAGLCHPDSMSIHLPFARWRSLIHAVACTVLSGCFGGQSGGDVGERPAPCACFNQGDQPVRARILRVDGGCAELEVLEVLTEPVPNEYLPLETGDVFGGVIVASCSGGPEFAEGEEVLAHFTRGTQATTTCVEYRACSAQSCGKLDDAKSTTIDPVCAQAQFDDPSVDCPPQEEWDQAAVAEYDRCDSQCFEETRQACAAHVAEEQVGGTVRLVAWQGDQAHYFWAGQQRSATFEELWTSECSARLAAEWEAWSSSRPRSPSTRQVANAPFEEPTIVQCPAGRSE